MAPALLVNNRRFPPVFPWRDPAIAFLKEFSRSLPFWLFLYNYFFSPYYFSRLVSYPQHVQSVRNIVGV